MGSSISKNIRNFGYFILIFVLAFGVVLTKPTQSAKAEAEIQISNCADLQNINHDGGVALGGSYIQTASFSCTDIANFVPLGTSGTPFLGTYDGGNFTISDLTINRPDTSYIGLFGMTNGSASISNVVLKDFTITGKNGVGGLIGANNSSGLVVANSHVSGNVTGRYYVGGLVGMNRGSITTSSSAATVTGGGAYQDYPVVGMVGGLVGRNGGVGSITNSYASGNVIGNDSYKNAGGLVGANLDWSGTIENSYALGDVSATDYVGGLVGYISGSGNITDSRAEGTVTGVDYVGGLLGRSISTITRSYATGNVTGQSNVGGLSGYSEGSITDSYATGIVTGNNAVGGLAGYSNGVITGSHATGSVNGSSNNVGGLVGVSQSNINRSYATGNVTGNIAVGGLTGYLNAPLRTSYASGSVNGNDRVGGLIGESNDSTYDSYATGNVTGADDVGGLIGLQNNGYNVQNTYDKGHVEGTSNVGGLIGYNDGGAYASIITSSYYDVTTAGVINNGMGGDPKTTAEMKTQSTFVDWVFSSPDGIWGIDTLGVNNDGYPYFQWQDFSGPTFEVLGSGDTRTINIDAGQVITTNPYIIKVLPDDPSGVTKVEFYIDNILICTDTSADADGYYTCSWDTSKYHSDVKVIAYDGLGNSTTLTRSTTVSLTGVPNTGLQPASFLPAGIVVIAGIGLMIIARRRIS